MAIDKAKITALAQKLAQKGQYDRAIKEYQRILAEDPKDTKVLQRIGDLYRRLNKPQEAIATYQRVAENFAQDGFFNKSVAVYQQIMHLQEELGQGPDEKLLVRLAEMYEQLALPLEASRVYQKLLTLYESLGEKFEALAVIKRMTNLDPTNLPLRLRLAEGYIRDNYRLEGDTEYNNLMKELRGSDREEDFVRVLERVVHHRPGEKGLLRELAELYLKRGEHRRGLLKLQEVIKLDPHDPESLRVLGNAFVSIGQPQKAASVKLQLAQMYKALKREEDALEIYTEVLQLDPLDPTARTEYKRIKKELSATKHKDDGAKPETPVAAPSPAPAAPRPAAAAPRPAPAPVSTATAAAASKPSPAATAAPIPERRRPSLSDEESRDRVSEAMVLVRYGLIDRAQPLLEAILVDDPANRDALSALRNIYLKQGDTTKARRVILQELLNAVHDGNKLMVEQIIDNALSVIPSDNFFTSLLHQLDTAAPPRIASFIAHELGLDKHVDDSRLDLPEFAGDIVLEPVATVVPASRVGHKVEIDPDEIDLSDMDAFETDDPQSSIAADFVNYQPSDRNDGLELDALDALEDGEDFVIDDSESLSDAVHGHSIREDEIIDISNAEILPDEIEEAPAFDEPEPRPSRPAPQPPRPTRQPPRPAPAAAPSASPKPAPSIRPAVPPVPAPSLLQADDDLSDIPDIDLGFGDEEPAPPARPQRSLSDEFIEIDDAAFEPTPDAPQHETPETTPASRFRDSFMASINDSGEDLAVALAEDDEIIFDDDAPPSSLTQTGGKEDSVEVVMSDDLDDDEAAFFAEIGAAPTAAEAPAREEERLDTSELPDLAEPPPLPDLMMGGELFGDIEKENAGKPVTAIDEYLEEATFFVEQGLYDEALEMLRQAESINAGDTRIRQTKDRIRQELRKGEALPPQVSKGGLTAQFYEDALADNSVDIGAEILDELGDDIDGDLLGGDNDDADGGDDAHKVLTELRRGVARLSRADVDTHYNLGTAYREMGLARDAIEEFRLCLFETDRQFYSLVNIALCQLLQDQHDAALASVHGAMSLGHRPADAVAHLLYELGCFFEDRGDLSQAKTCFSWVRQQNPAYGQAADKLADLEEEGIEASDGDSELMLYLRSLVVPARGSMQDKRSKISFV